LIPLEEIRRARERIGDSVRVSPPLQFDEVLEASPAEPATPSGRPRPPAASAGRIWLKLENLHPIGCFKLRGALNKVRSEPEVRDLVTASAGNMAQGVAWAAREVGVGATIVAPETAPRTKLAAAERLGARVVPVPYEEWWQAMVDRGREGIEGLFVHPTDDPAVMAGNGTIGLELCEQLDAFDTVIVPWGGGGLTLGIASAVKGLRPGTRVVAAEPATGAPLSAAFAAGAPTEIEFERSFVDGAGGPALLPGMWEGARALVDEAVPIPLAEVEDAIRLLASRAHVVAEGAGALALAAALHRDDRCVCIVSGGNIDPEVYAGILSPAATA
jgi:threonine dehydratase